MNNLPPPPKKKRSFRKFFTYLLLLLSVILLGTTGYFFYQYKKIAGSQIKAEIAAQEEAQKLTMAVGKLMLLPQDETPTLATVTDIEKLKDQLFFKNAANGNKVLIYPNAKLAIVYDPEANLIINVGPINFSEQEQKTE